MSLRTINMVVFGEKCSGKTQLLAKFRDRHALFRKNYFPTLAADYLILDKGKYHYRIWDCSGDEKYDALLFNSIQQADIGLLCVDLSQPSLNEELIYRYLEKMEASPSQPNIIVAGTCYDKAHPDTLRQFWDLHNQLSSPVRGACITSARTAVGIKDLSHMIHDVLSLPADSTNFLRQDPHSLSDPLNAAIALTGVEGESSVLHEKLCDLDRMLKRLHSRHHRRQTGLYAEQLVQALQDPQADKKNAIIQFERNCRTSLQGSHPLMRATLKIALAVVATATVFFLSAIIGFAVGFALGFWTGPGAFFTGLATGSGVSLLVGSAVAGTAVGGLALMGLFGTFQREAAVKSAIADVAMVARADMVSI